MCLHKSIVQQFAGNQRVKTWSRFYFLFCTALPHELLVAVLRHFSLKEIVGTLSKVSKRWWNISQTDGLWQTLPLDKWNVCHLTEAQFLNIVSHSRAFSHFSMSYVDVKVSQSRLNAILQNSLWVAHKLTHLDLSGQPIRNLTLSLPSRPEPAAEKCAIIPKTAFVLMPSHLPCKAWNSKQKVSHCFRHFSQSYYNYCA